jgi:hypothetical protein
MLKPPSPLATKLSKSFSLGVSWPSLSTKTYHALPTKPPLISATSPTYLMTSPISYPLPSSLYHPSTYQQESSSALFLLFYCATVLSGVMGALPLVAYS